MGCQIKKKVIYFPLHLKLNIFSIEIKVQFMNIKIIFIILEIFGNSRLVKESFLWHNSYVQFLCIFFFKCNLSNAHIYTFSSIHPLPASVDFDHLRYHFYCIHGVIIYGILLFFKILWYSYSKGFF